MAPASREYVLSRIESHVLGIKETGNEQDARKSALVAEGYVSALREFEHISHSEFKKASSDIEDALNVALRVFDKGV